MSILILWDGTDRYAEQLVQKLNESGAVTIDVIKAAPPVNGVRRSLHQLFGIELRFRPLGHDLRSHQAIVACFSVPRGHVPIEVASFLRQRRAEIAALACVMVTDHFVSDTASAIMEVERLAGQSLVTLLEMPRPELGIDGRGHPRPWLVKCRIESFIGKLHSYRS